MIIDLTLGCQEGTSEKFLSTTQSNSKFGISLEASVRAGLGRINHGLLVSSSRGIIYASSDLNNFGPAAANASSNLRENINNILEDVGRSFI